MAPVLVVAAGSRLGRDVVAAFSRAGHQVAARERDRLDVTDRRACLRLLRRLRPLAVVDCSDPPPASAATAAAALGGAAAAVDALSIHLSSADVFDGRRLEPYVESDPPGPADPLGAAKLAAERAVAQANPRHAIVRSAWLFAPHDGGFAEELLEQGLHTDRLAIDAVARGTPTYSGHLALALVGLLRRPAYGIFHAAGEGCTRLQFARALFTTLQLPCQAVASVGEGVPARQLVLATCRSDPLLVPDWRLGLHAWLQARDEPLPSGSPR